jgi:hypothetical protein
MQMKTLKVMDSTGDSTVTFDADIDNEAKSEGRKLFDKIMAKGGNVFAVNRAGATDKKVTSFDELEAENVVVPRIAGG